MRDPQDNAWKGAAAGLVAGLAATWAMTRFQELSGKLAGNDSEERAPQHSAKRGTRESTEGNGQGEDATVRAADRLSRGLFHHGLGKREKEVAGPALHYGFGALTGAVYGALAELTPGVTLGAGAPFGAAVWLAADEITVPALRLSGPPWEYPPMVHARALGAHLVYGLATEGLRRLVRRVL